MAAVRRRWLPALVCLLIVPIGVFAWASRRADTYDATASLLFRAPEAQTGALKNTFFAEALDRNRRAATNLQLVSLRNIAARAARTLGGGATADSVTAHMKVSGEPASDLISITGNSTSPQEAARIANAVAAGYIGFRRDANRTRIAEAQDLVRRRIASLTPEELDSARGRTLRRQAVELQNEQSVEEGDAEVVENAQAPTAPANTSAKRFAALGLLGGAGLALLVVLALERLDRRVRDPDEAAQVLDLPELATLHSAAPSDALRAGSLVWAELARVARHEPPRFIAVTAARGEAPAPALLRGLVEAARRDGIEAVIAEPSDMAGEIPAAAQRLAGLGGDGRVVLALAPPLLVLELARLDADGVYVLATARPGETRYASLEELRHSLMSVRRLALGLVVVTDRRRWAALRVG